MDHVGVIVAQFERVEPAEEAAGTIAGSAVLVAASPELLARLQEFGMSPAEAEMARTLIDPSAVVFLARASDETARTDLRALWDLRGGNFLYVPTSNQP